MSPSHSPAAANPVSSHLSREEARAAVTELPSSPPSPRFYRPELDVLRFFAFLGVLCRHATREGGTLGPAAVLGWIGGFGLPLFFCLSAYLITELLQREKTNCGTIHIKAFYIRRSLRIWPLYFAFIPICIAYGHWLAPSQALSSGLVISFALMAGNWYAGQNGFGKNPIFPLWSISIEEQFYLCWPLLNKVASKRLVVLVAVGLLPVAWLSTLLVGRAANAENQIWTNTFVNFQFFALGALLAILTFNRLPKTSPRVRFTIAAAAACSWLVAGYLLHPYRGPLLAIAANLLIGIGAIGFIYSVLGIPAKYVPKPLIYLGKISYGLYVFHVLCLQINISLLTHLHITSQPVLKLEHVSIAMLSTIALAAISYRFFEYPFLKLKDRFTFIRSRAV